MRHKIIIRQVNGKIVHISASGETDIVVIESTPSHHSISKIEPDIEFESGKSHEFYSHKETSEFLKEHGI